MAEILSATVIRLEVESGGFPTGNYFRRKSRLRRRLLARDVREIGFPDSAKTTRSERDRGIRASPRPRFLIKTGRSLPGLAYSNMDVIVR